MPMIDVKATGDKIKAFAVANNMSAKDIQDIFGFGTPQTVFKWFRGATIPNIDNMVILAKIFHVTMDDIVVTI